MVFNTKFLPAIKPPTSAPHSACVVINSCLSQLKSTVWDIYKVWLNTPPITPGTAVTLLKTIFETIFYNNFI